MYRLYFFFFQAEDGIRDDLVTGVQTCALPISCRPTPDCRWSSTAPSPDPPPRTASGSWPAGRRPSTRSSRRRRPRRPRTHDRQRLRCARARQPGAMTSPAQSVERDAVSPLELFFDLVFVFAVSQLSHHLLDHLSWRGAAETLVLLIAV